MGLIINGGLVIDINHSKVKRDSSDDNPAADESPITENNAQGDEAGEDDSGDDSGEDDSGNQQ